MFITTCKLFGHAGCGKWDVWEMAQADLQYCPCGAVFNISWRWSSSLGPRRSQTALLAAFLGHIKNELGQTPDVLTGCWDALIFTLLEKLMSLLLHTSVLKQKVRWEFVQNRAFQFYLAFKFCYVWVIVKKISSVLQEHTWTWKNAADRWLAGSESGCSHADADD